MTKVLHLVAGRLDGGAARGAYWLHKALGDKGIESRILTNSRDDLGDSSVISINQNLLSRINLAVRREIGRLPIKAYRRRQATAFNTSFAGIDFTRHSAYAAADIVHLHWVNGLVSTRSLTHLEKPVVWTLRDMWPFTGGCHHALDCDRFTERCGHCPQLGSARDEDLSRRLLDQKAAAVPEKLHVVGISRWISEQARRSSVFRRCNISTVSNNIDTDLFFPVEKELARRAMGFDDGLRVVLIGAQYMDSIYKGFDLFRDALRELGGERFRLCTFGNPGAEMPQHPSIEVTHLGPLSDAVSLRLAYSAADVFVAPSRAESFGKTLAEAMGCGTPVVCFDATGPKDIVEHRKDGYKAKPFDPKDLAEGIRWVLSLDPAEHEALCARARHHAITRFDSRVIAEQYLDIYRTLLGRAKPDAAEVVAS